MDRNTIMNDFLAATGLEDIGRALEILEQHDWNLLGAVNSVIPQDFSPLACLQPAAQSHMPATEGRGSLTLPDSPLLRMPVQESHSNLQGQLVETDSVPGLVMRNAGADPGPDMPELPMMCRGEGGRRTYDMATDDVKMSCFLREKYNPYDLSSPTAGRSEEQRSKQASHVLENGEQHFSDNESQDSEQYFSPAEEFGLSHEDDEEEEEEEEEADIEESGFTDPKYVAHGPLIPVECKDPHLALQVFTSNFEARYGSTCPLFFVGSLAEAIKEATGGNANTRKPLLIYLHHDRSILSNIFCSQLLCAESVVNLLSANFISWAWDLTGKEQKEALLHMVKAAFGEEIAESVESVKSDNLPVILIVCKMDGKVEVQNIIQGHTDLETLIGHLLTAMEIHTENQQRDAIEERARIEREMMIEEQDQRYRQSLEADRMKEVKRVEAERQMLQKQENEIAAKQRYANAVPAEPPPDFAGLTATLRFRCPGGETMQRRFRAEETLGILLNFLGSQGYPSSDYKVLTSYPRRDISQSDSTQTFESLKLCPQETLFVEER